MTYEEFKKVIVFLDIKFVQVVMNKEEYLKFKEIDLFSEQSNIFIEIHNWLDGQGSNLPKEEIMDRYAFWLDINDDFKIVEYSTMFSDYNIYSDKSIDMFDDGERFQVKNQIILSYDKFIDLIS